MTVYGKSTTNIGVCGLSESIVSPIVPHLRPPDDPSSPFAPSEPSRDSSNGPARGSS
jgi:hypothetical protein